MQSTKPDIQLRTKLFALRIIRLYAALPQSTVPQIIGKQLLRSATSVGAHVREGKHSRSAAEMFSKVSVALQEAEESRYWLELLADGAVLRKERLRDICEEVDTLIAILYASTKTLKRTLR